MMDAGIIASMGNDSNALAATTTANIAMNALSKKKPMSDAQADKVSQDFESMFVSQMLEQMFGDSVGSELFGDSESSEVYKGLMVEQYGKKIAQSGGIGIAGYVKAELLKLQEI